MAAILFFGPAPGHHVVADAVPPVAQLPAAALGAVVHLDRWLRPHARGGFAAAWGRAADGRLVCRWTPLHPAPGAGR